MAASHSSVRPVMVTDLPSIPSICAAKWTCTRATTTRSVTTTPRTVAPRMENRPPARMCRRTAR